MKLPVKVIVACLGIGAAKILFAEASNFDVVLLGTAFAIYSWLD